DLPLAVGVHEDARHGGLAALEQPELTDVDVVLCKLALHLAARGIIAAPSPERRAAAESRHGNRSRRRHAAAHGGELRAPDLLAFAGEEPRHAPDLVERGQAEADHARVAGAVCKMARWSRAC